MADLDLARRPNGKHDFVLAGNSLALTSDPFPAIYRLLIQGSWIGDDGERAGQSLGDVQFTTNKTVAQVQRIAESRLAALLRSNQLTSVTVLEVVTLDGRLYATIRVTIPGQQPKNIQVPLTA